jgi:hypothetical protein
MRSHRLRFRQGFAPRPLFCVRRSYYYSGDLEITMTLGSSDFKDISMDDLGTRMNHYMDLQHYWSSAHFILTRPGYHTQAEKDRAKSLETALSLLQHFMEVDYNPTTIARVINALPKDAKGIPNDIPGDITTHRDTI